MQQLNKINSTGSVSAYDYNEVINEYNVILVKYDNMKMITNILNDRIDLALKILDKVWYSYTDKEVTEFIELLKKTLKGEK